MHSNILHKEIMKIVSDINSHFKKSTEQDWAKYIILYCTLVSPSVFYHQAFLQSLVS